MGGSNLKQPVSATAMERWPWAVRGLPHGRCGGCADLLDQAAECFSAAARVSLGCAGLLVPGDVWRRCVRRHGSGPGLSLSYQYSSALLGWVGARGEDRKSVV